MIYTSQGGHSTQGTNTNNKPTIGATTTTGNAALNQPKTLKSVFSDLTNRFFKNEDGMWSEHCKTKFGLEQPLWVWTHRAMTTASVAVSSPMSPVSPMLYQSANGALSPASSPPPSSVFENLTTLEVTRIGNLIHWLVSNAHLKGEEIAVVCATAQKKLLAESKHSVGTAMISGVGVGTNAPNASAASKADLASHVDEAQHFSQQKSLVTVLDHQEAIALHHKNKQQQQQSTPSLNSVGIASNTSKKYSIVIYAMGIPLDPTYLEFMNTAGCLATQQSAEMCGDCYIMICDAAWMYAPVIGKKCPEWSALVRDVLHGQSPKIRMPKEFAKSLKSAGLASTPGLIAAKIPICCPQHPQERALADGNTIFEGFCNAKCLKPYACRENEAKLAAFVAQQHTTHALTIANAKLLHFCQNRCHLSTNISSHKTCPYSCATVIHPCGQRCELGCADNSCTCGHDIEVPLDCYHDIVVGFDSEKFAPITERVFHVFRGACVDLEKAKQQCCVNVPTICAVCAGDFVAPCHSLTAVGHEVVEGKRTAICEACVRRQRDIRAQVRNELIREIDAKRTKAQQDLKMQQYLEKIGKGAGVVQQQSFDIGQRVVIVDMESRRQPYEFDHPECTFVYFHDEDQYFAKVQGGHGVVVKSVVDGSEQQYIILLASGQHVLFASNGLKAVKAIGNFELTGASLTQTYLLTVGPEKFQQQQQDGSSNSNNNTTSTVTTTPFTALVKPQFGKSAIVIKPISVKPPREFMITPLSNIHQSDTSSGEQPQRQQLHDSYTTPEDESSRGEILMSNIVGTIVGEDAAASLANGQPMVKFQVEIKFVDEAAEESQEADGGGLNEEEGKEPDAKRCRSETKAEQQSVAATSNHSPHQVKKRKEKTITMIIAAPFLHLEVISLCEARITHSDKQIVGPDAHALFTSLAAESYGQYLKRGGFIKSSLLSSQQQQQLPLVAIRDAPATKAEMFSVVGIVNHPIVRKDLQPLNVELDVDEELGGLFTTKAPCVVLESRIKPMASSTTAAGNNNSKEKGDSSGKTAFNSSSSSSANVNPTVAKLQQQIAQLKAIGCSHPAVMQGLERQLAAALAAAASSAAANKSSSETTNNSYPPLAGSIPLVVVPLLFVDVDEEAAAERQLEATEFARLELLFDERYKKISEDLAFANEEKRVMLEEKLAALTPYPKRKKNQPMSGNTQNNIIAAAEADMNDNAEEGGGGGEDENDDVKNEQQEELPTNYMLTADILRRNGIAPVASSPDAALVAATLALKAWQLGGSGGGSATDATPMLIVNWREEEQNEKTAGTVLSGTTPQKVRASSHDTLEHCEDQFSGDLSLFSPFHMDLSNSHVVGHVNSSQLTDQQRLNKVWAYCYCIPKAVITPQALLDVRARREKMPQTPSLAMFELSRRRALLSKQPSEKVIEKWAKDLDAVADDQNGDYQYGLAVSKLAEEKMAVKK